MIGHSIHQGAQTLLEGATEPMCLSPHLHGRWCTGPDQTSRTVCLLCRTPAFSDSRLKLFSNLSGCRAAERQIPFSSNRFSSRAVCFPLTEDLKDCPVKDLHITHLLPLASPWSLNISTVSLVPVCLKLGMEAYFQFPVFWKNWVIVALEDCTYKQTPISKNMK